MGKKQIYFPAIKQYLVSRKPEPSFRVESSPFPNLEVITVSVPKPCGFRPARFHPGQILPSQPKLCRTWICTYIHTYIYICICTYSRLNKSREDFACHYHYYYHRYTLDYSYSIYRGSGLSKKPLVILGFRDLSFNQSSLFDYILTRLFTI